MNTNCIEETNRGLICLVLLVLIGCSVVSQSSVAKNNQRSNNAAMENQSNKAASDAIESRLVSANSRFGFKLFAEVAKQNAGKNVFISPASVGLALAMTYNGAVGETKQGMERALEIQGMNLSSVHLRNPRQQDRSVAVYGLDNRSDVRILCRFKP